VTGLRNAWSHASAIACAMALVLATLSGCTPSAPEISTAAAKQLQASVSAVTNAAASGNIAGAIADLDTLETQVREATASGAISTSRTARIQATISLVRADLTAALPPPSPTPSTEAPDQQGNNSPGKDNGKNKRDKGEG
jgi:hypothetical protein